MKAVAVVHMFSHRSFRTGSYTRSLIVGRLVAVSRHLAVVLGGGLACIYILYIYIHIYICQFICIYAHMSIHICIYIHLHTALFKSLC